MKNQLKIGAFLSYAQMLLGVVVSLVYTPVMLRLLGPSEYGLYNTVSSAISMLSLLSLGFNAGYIRYYAKYKKENDTGSIHKLNGLFLIIFSAIGAIALLCGLFLTNNLQLVFEEGLTAGEYEIARALMLLLTVNLSVTFVMTTFSTIISAHERFVYLKLLGMLRTVGGPLVTWPLLLMGYRSIAMVAVTLTVSVVVDILYLFYVFAILRQRFVFHHFEKGLFRDLFVFTSFIAINMVVDQINWNIGKIMLGRYRGTVAVAVYSVGYTLYTYYQYLSQAVAGVFTPRIHHTVTAAQDKKQLGANLTDLMTRVGRIQFIVLGLVATGLIFFGRPFILSVWAGAGYEDSYAVVLLLSVPAIVPLIQNIGIEIQRAENKHKFRSIVYLLMALINVVASVFLCQAYGAVGSAIATAVSLVVANGIIMNIYYHKSCGLNMLYFWGQILRLLPSLILPVACGIALPYFMDFYASKVALLLGIAIYTAVYVISVWFIGMNAYEKNLVMRPIKAICGKLFKRNVRNTDGN